MSWSEPLPGDRYQDKDERSGVRVVEVVKVEGYWPWIQMVLRDGKPSVGPVVRIRPNALATRYRRLG
jgi:hypothetical protein